MTTVIHYNGSKWDGEQPDSIEHLLAVLASEPLEPMFEGEHIFDSESRPGVVMFFGNFANLWHVFRIETADLKTQILLRRAIRANLSGQSYLEACERWGWNTTVQRQAARRLEKWKQRAAA